MKEQLCRFCDKFSHFCTSRNTRGIDVPGEDGTWAYLRCMRCRSLVIDRKTNVLEVYVAEKPRQHYGELHPLVRLKHRLLGHPLQRQFGRSDFAGFDVLDVGCGNGAKLYEFYRRGARVSGIELSDDKIAVARRNMPDGRFCVGHLQESGFNHASFDIIVVDNVLEHIPDSDEFLRQACAYLKPGGRAVFYVPNGRALSVRLLRERAASVWPPFHICLFTAKYFRIHFPDLSIQCVSQSHFFLLRDALTQFLKWNWLSTLSAFIFCPWLQRNWSLRFSGERIRDGHCCTHCLL